jgi:hypothetical protein
MSASENRSSRSRLKLAAVLVLGTLAAASSSANAGGLGDLIGGDAGRIINQSGMPVARGVAVGAGTFVGGVLGGPLGAAVGGQMGNSWGQAMSGEDPDPPFPGAPMGRFVPRTLTPLPAPSSNDANDALAHLFDDE